MFIRNYNGHSDETIVEILPDKTGDVIKMFFFFNKNVLKGKVTFINKLKHREG